MIITIYTVIKKATRSQCIILLAVPKAHLKRMKVRASGDCNKNNGKGIMLNIRSPPQTSHGDNASRKREARQADTG
ncbi:MAG: hypothetical protein QXW58_04040, partial [Thermosphaera sp.]